MRKDLLRVFRGDNTSADFCIQERCDNTSADPNNEQSISRNIHLQFLSNAKCVFSIISAYTCMRGNELFLFTNKIQLEGFYPFP